MPDYEPVSIGFRVGVKSAIDLQVQARLAQKPKSMNLTDFVKDCIIKSGFPAQAQQVPGQPVDLQPVWEQIAKLQESINMLRASMVETGEPKHTEIIEEIGQASEELAAKVENMGSAW